MSYTFSRRDFLKYSAMTAVAVAGAGLLTGCEIQDPNNPVIKKLGYGTTLGTTGGLLKSVDTEGTTGVFTFTVKNNSDASLRMDPNESFVVKVLDKDGIRFIPAHISLNPSMSAMATTKMKVDSSSGRRRTSALWKD